MTECTIHPKPWDKVVTIKFRKTSLFNRIFRRRIDAVVTYAPDHPEFTRSWTYGRDPEQDLREGDLWDLSNCNVRFERCEEVRPSVQRTSI